MDSIVVENLTIEMTKDEIENFSKIQSEFMKSYSENSEKVPLKEWLGKEVKRHLNEKSEKEIENIITEILETIENNEKNRKSLEKAIESGSEIETWFAKKIENVVENSPNIEKVEYLNILNNAMEKCNEAMYYGVTTENYSIGKNFNLDKFIAEQRTNEKVVQNNMSQENIIYDVEYEDFSKDDLEKVKNGEINIDNWNRFNTKKVAVEIGQKAMYAGVQNVAMGNSFNSISKFLGKKDTDGNSAVEKAFKEGDTKGISVAVAGALKVSAERGSTKILPKDTQTLANIAYKGVESSKILYDISIGKTSLNTGFKRFKELSTSMLASFGLPKKGQKLGANLGMQIGMIFGPQGAMIGNFIGANLGKFVGSKIEEFLRSGEKKLREYARQKVKEVGKSVKSIAKKTYNKAKDKVKSFFRRK